MKRLSLAAAVLALPVLMPAGCAPLLEDTASPRDAGVKNENRDNSSVAPLLNRDSLGNTSFGQCLNRAERRRIICQQRARDGVEIERCYSEEDRQILWCQREWDRRIGLP